MTESCIFCRILDGSTPARIVYQDEQVIAIQDIAPQAPHHYLIIPRTHIPTLLDLGEAPPELTSAAFAAARTITSRMGFADAGFRVVVNCNRDGGQTVRHLHFHLLGGRQLSWPPG
ncbi:histidine triad nucleotide-binding protein [Candidatus Moduliflexota bacterium]